MIAEILSVGTELLMGQIANTDAQYISRRLSELGVTLYRHTTVGDNPARVKQALAEALSRSDMVITTGGLGPTEDDLTKEMVGEFFGLPMELDEKSLEAVRARMCRLGREMTENNNKQAYFPRGAIIMPNECGTAPGCIVERDGQAVAVLPGPPREMKDMFERQLAPWLRKRSGGEHIESRFLRIFGVGESKTEMLLLDLFHGDNPTLALYCGAGEVTARISARVPLGEDASALIDPMEAEIRRRLGNAVYAAYGPGDEVSLASTVLKMLAKRGETVTTAESCTGGMLISHLIDCPGASAAVHEGHVTYSNEAKMRVLGVRAETLEQYGAVSAECALEMAEGARRVSGSTWAIATTGVAGPDGGTPEKPVGLVYVGIAGPDGVRAERLMLRGDRDWIRTLTCQNALNLLRAAVPRQCREPAPSAPC